MNKTMPPFYLVFLIMSVFIGYLIRESINKYNFINKIPQRPIDYVELKLPIDSYCISHHPKYKPDTFLYSKSSIIVWHSLDGVNFYIADSFEVHSEDVYIRNFTRPVNRKVSYTIQRHINY